MKSTRTRVLAAGIALVALLAAYLVGKGSAQIPLTQPMMAPALPSQEIPMVTPIVVDGKVYFGLNYPSTFTMYVYNDAGQCLSLIHI